MSEEFDVPVAPGPGTVEADTAPAARCPVMHLPANATGSTANQHWWPEQLNLRVLNKNSPQVDPMGADFQYARAFEDVDLDAVIDDLNALMTDSQPWWPADFGHYGPLFIRMAWHSAGTYRISDGRGGANTGSQRFAPLNSWPDNVNLDKARRLLWPIKQKYGSSLSWSDLMILAGNVALESMGFTTFGFGGGRADVWEPEEDVYWGPEATWLADERYTGDRELSDPLGAVQMGLIYVNPEGPNGNPDPVAAARDIRETFARMAMDDEETVALIAGGHTFGKVHGAGSADHVGPEPEGALLEQMGLGWANSFRSGKGADTISSGLEGAWTSSPAAWDMGFFDTLFGYEWELTKSPAGAHQWKPKGDAGSGTVPDAHLPDVTHQPMMLTTDLSLREDPIYGPISRRFHENPDQFADAFARAWFKLTHRDMGPLSRYKGKLVPTEQLLWQDPLPAVEHALVSDSDVGALKDLIAQSNLSTAQLVKLAWASASTFRDSDNRGGANGARVRLEPQRHWPVNDPEELNATLEGLETIRGRFNEGRTDDVRISLADLIVLAGGLAIESAANAGGLDISVRFTPGRTDASDLQTDPGSFGPLEPRADGFRNFNSPAEPRRPEDALIDRACLLGLTAPEMTVLVGGLRVLGATAGSTNDGVFTDRVGTLSTDFFVNVLDAGITWSDDGTGQRFVGTDAGTGEPKWTATRVDLIFGSNSRLRALSEVYAAADGAQRFADDFAAAWSKVMELDRFDLR
ncbi:MAG: catalase/peroxidase HPI [Acidimicrobiia bacterium]|nr:catalase/peroxidase HPI [Acidimicrobiia bacterium]